MIGIYDGWSKRLDPQCLIDAKIMLTGHAETAHNRIASVVLGFKEALLEEAEKKKDKRKWVVKMLTIFYDI